MELISIYRYGYLIMNINKYQVGSNVILEGQPPLRGESITRQSVAPEQARGHKG